MATENQKIIAARVLKKVKKGEKISITKEMRESGVYSEATSKHPEKVTGSKGWKELMERYLPDELLSKVHTQLLEAKKLDTMIFPPTSGITDDEIRAFIESCGCVVRKITRGEKQIFVFFYAPDNKARNDALDKGYKLKGRYAPMRVYTEPDPLDDLTDEELQKQLAEVEAERQRRSTTHASKKGKIAPLGEQPAE